MTKTYLLCNMPTVQETGEASFSKQMVIPSLGIYPRNFRAIATNEVRIPKKGEWYLSGADVAAYKAPNDLLSAYTIARLVRVEVVPSSYKIVAVL